MDWICEGDYRHFSVDPAAASATAAKREPSKAGKRHEIFTRHSSLSFAEMNNYLRLRNKYSDDPSEHSLRKSRQYQAKMRKSKEAHHHQAAAEAAAEAAAAEATTEGAPGNVESDHHHHHQQSKERNMQDAAEATQDQGEIAEFQRLEKIVAREKTAFLKIAENYANTQHARCTDMSPLVREVASDWVQDWMARSSSLPDRFQLYRTIYIGDSGAGSSSGGGQPMMQQQASLATPSQPLPRLNDHVAVLMRKKKLYEQPVPLPLPKPAVAENHQHSAEEQHSSGPRTPPVEPPVSAECASDTPQIPLLPSKPAVTWPSLRDDPMVAQALADKSSGPGRRCVFSDGSLEQLAAMQGSGFGAHFLLPVLVESDVVLVDEPLCPQRITPHVLSTLVYEQSVLPPFLASSATAPRDETARVSTWSLGSRHILVRSQRRSIQLPSSDTLVVPVAKLEHIPDVGLESPSAAERAMWWSRVFFCGASEALVCRIDPATHSLMKLDAIMLANLEGQFRREEYFATLATVVEGIAGLPDGQYLLSHRPEERHLSILSEVTGARACDLDLRVAETTCGMLDLETISVQPLELHIDGCKVHRIPFLFPPKQHHASAPHSAQQRKKGGKRDAPSDPGTADGGRPFKKDKTKKHWHKK